jgi:enoyl-CoA hydratase
VSDIAVVADSAKIGLPNVRSLGISLLSTAWPLLIGPARTKLMMYTGDTISGAQASEWGLVALSVPEAELTDTVTQIARRIALMPGDLLKTMKLASSRALESIGLEQLVASAVEIDTIAHFSQPVMDFWKSVGASGLKAALTARDAPYAEGGLSALLDRGSAGDGSKA